MFSISINNVGIGFNCFGMFVLVVVVVVGY